jgi:hypothetical protein
MERRIISPRHYVPRTVAKFDSDIVSVVSGIGLDRLDRHNVEDFSPSSPTHHSSIQYCMRMPRFEVDFA